MPDILELPVSSGGSAVTTGTDAEMAALSAAAGDLFYNTTFKTLFYYVENRWLPSTIDPRYGYQIFDDFISGTTTTGSIGWTTAGTINVAATGTATNHGVFGLRTTSASSRTLVALRSDSTILGSSKMHLEFGASVPTLATAGEDFSLALGLSDAAAYVSGSDATDGVYFVLNRGVNGANWIIKTASNGSITPTNTSTAVVAGTYYRLGIMITSASAAEFFVNGTSVGTINATIPNGAGRSTGVQMRIDKIAGTGNSDLNIDYFHMYALYNAARVA
jgi:hypothetical protein